jgi:hypothetical protein
LAGESGNLLVACWALALLGRTAGALGDVSQAHAQLVKSLRLAWSLKNRASVVFVLVLFAELWLSQGNEAQAAQALQVALGDPAASQTTKALIARLLDQSKPLEDEAPSLEAVVKRILHHARLAL